jgi:hypothetical protein
MSIVGPTPEEMGSETHQHSSAACACWEVRRRRARGVVSLLQAW